MRNAGFGKCVIQIQKMAAAECFAIFSDLICMYVRLTLPMLSTYRWLPRYPKHILHCAPRCTVLIGFHSNSPCSAQ